METKNVDLDVEMERYRNPKLFWQIFSTALTIFGLFLALNYTFRFRLLGRMEIETSYLYLLFACFLSQVFIFVSSQKKILKETVPWKVLKIIYQKMEGTSYIIV